MHVSIVDQIRHLNSNLSMSLKVKCDGCFGLPIFEFLLVFNSNIWPNSAALRDISLWNLSDIDIDLSFKVTEVKCNHTNGLPIYAFLLMFNSNIWPTPLLYKIQGFEIWVILTLTFLSNVIVSSDSPCMVSYWYILVTDCLPLTV